MIKNVLIHFFSGTGNTAHVADMIEKRLIEKNSAVVKLNIEDEFIFSLDDYDLHIILFPIYGFGIPHIMIKHLMSFNDVEKIKAVVFGIGGHTGKIEGEEGRALTHAYNILSRRGFLVIYTKLFSYPENFTQVFNTPDKEAIRDILKESDQKVLESVKEILENKISLKKHNIFVYGLYSIVYFFFRHFGRIILGKVYITDKNCNGCKTCQNLCPVQNIRMIKQKPRWGYRCEACQRCINICPKQSIQSSTVKFTVLILLTFIPIYPVIVLNKLISLHFLLDILMYFIFFVVLTVIFDYLFFILEQNKYTRKIMQLNFTHHFRRYIAKDIKFNKGVHKNEKG